jgi:hypothetical protein
MTTIEINHSSSPQSVPNRPFRALGCTPLEVWYQCAPYCLQVSMCSSHTPMMTVTSWQWFAPSGQCNLGVLVGCVVRHPSATHTPPCSRRVAAPDSPDASTPLLLAGASASPSFPIACHVTPINYLDKRFCKIASARSMSVTRRLHMATRCRRV